MFRNGKCYFIRIIPNERFQGSRNLIIKEKEISIVQEMGLNETELNETFEVIFDVPKMLNNSIINNLRKCESFWLLTRISNLF
jgi:hypothetical protein